jgi:Cu2+-exporting ATPase
VPFSTACLRAADDAETRTLARALGIAAFGAMNVMLVSVAVWVGTDMGAATRGAMHWLAALIGLPIIAVAGLPFYRSALAALRAGRANMDVAISLAVLATAAMSLSEAARNGPYTWFDGATMLLALLLAGRLLDRTARARAGRALAELLALQGGSMRRLRPDGSAEEVAVAALLPGERVLLAPGERLAVDARLEDSEGILDLAAITGESLPRALPPGAAVAAGAVNMGPSVVLAVAARAADGSLAAMGRLLEAAAQGRSRFVGIADRAARLYVPVVLVVSAATFLGWWLLGGVEWRAALVPAVATLIITCPCGLALAVPAVQAVAVGALFRRGILVTSPTALERLASANHALLDKTGTLTAGLPALLPGDWAEADLCRAAGLAQASRHPLAQALARACPDAPAAAGVVEHPGLGLELGGTRLGSARFVGVRFVGAADDDASLFLAEPGRPTVRFAFAGPPHPTSAGAVCDLRALGLGVELASGDRPAAVAALAEALGIERVTAEATPDDKAALLQARRQAGARVAMVGDGINDAPALALAHVGIAAGRATDLARAAADIVLRGEGIAQLPAAIRIARRAQAIARQNIFLSLGYNVVAVPLAIAGLVTPLVAAAVMASSSLAVTLNALRAGRPPFPGTSA